MLIIEPWDADPDALHLTVLPCVVCGEYTGNDDLVGYLHWEPNRGSPALAYHVGVCSQKMDALAHALEDGPSVLDDHTRYRLAHLSNNVLKPPKKGQGGLLRRQRPVLDLVATHDFLVRLGSPLVRGNETE